MPTIRTDRTFARVLRSPTLAVAAAFLVRMVLLWLSHHGDDPWHPKFQTVGLEDHLVASSLAAGKGFFGPYPNYPEPTACVAPIYPFLWAIGEKLFHLSFPGATIFAQVMNCVFSAATCWPIFGIGSRAFSRGGGLASAWLWVLLPYAVLFPLEWTWDQSLSALMLTLIMYLTFVLCGSSSSLSLTGYGLLWAFAAMVNPTLCILLPFLLGWLILQRGPFTWTSLGPAAKIILVFVLALLPWTIRNYYAIDGLVFVKSNFGLEFWLGNNPAVKEIYTPELHPAVNYWEDISLIANGEPNYNHEKQLQAIAFIETYPREFLKNVSDRFEDTWSATYDSRVDPWVKILHATQVNIWFCLGFSVFSVAGMILALGTNWQNALPPAMALLLFPIPYYITHTALRYRHPIDPFMTIFTVYAIARLRRVFASDGAAALSAFSNP